MSLSSVVSLGALRIQAQQRADLENSPNISTPEWNQYLSQSYKELYDLLVSAYGNDYFVSAPYPFVVSQFVTLPSNFYKLIGVDIQYGGSPTGWVTIKRFEFIERNKYSYTNATSGSAVVGNNFHYRITGTNLQFPPNTSGNGQMWYIPEPTPLQYIPTCSTTLSSAVVGVSDSTDLSVGMSVSGSGVPDGTTVLSIDTVLDEVTLSASCTLTQPVVPIFFWTDAATMDGISGWEEYVIIDAAIKAQIKQEQPIDELLNQKNFMKDRIAAMAEGRDAGQAQHVSDVLGSCGYDDGYGYGGGMGMGWDY